VRYLLGRMPGATAIVISGAALRRISEACSIARALQPSVIVLEDVDLIAEPRGPQPSQPSPLSQLLNEMDGLTADADVTFLLTTHRPDLLEEALAARPGRVDHTARLPLPDAIARRRLLRLYQGNLRISRATAAAVVDRTDGVTASFIKELLRRAALHAAVGTTGRLTRSPPATAAGALIPASFPASPAASATGTGIAGALATEGQASALRVTSRHLNRALDELLDSRNQLTGLLLGGRPARGADAIIRPVLPRLHPGR
jgi:SpoVK/Ycf46/Vps4 family AAA+-type ATPase